MPAPIPRGCRPARAPARTRSRPPWRVQCSPTVATEYPVPSGDDLDRMFTALSNWGRWGDDDERGALNHLTDARRAAAGGLVRTGEAVSLAYDLGTEPSHREPPTRVHHHMLAAGDARDANGIPGYEAARDYIGLDVHGLTTTHVDALSHMFVRGEMFGGRPASATCAATGR